MADVLTVNRIDNARPRVDNAGNKIDVFKVTKGGCYEIYGRDAAGKRIEIYFNPLSGDVMQHS